MNMPKLGLKLWSTNDFYIQQANDLYQHGIFDYGEIYVVPGSEKEYLQTWTKSEFPIFLHAPHSNIGFNFSLREKKEGNRQLLKEVESFRIALNPVQIIFHPGVQGSEEETIRQIKMFKNEFPYLFNLAVIENKPKIALNGETCVGASPEEMKRLLKETGLGFCLDIGHAICYAAWRKNNYEDILEEFLAMKPKIFHLSDGDTKSEMDKHLNFGSGNFELSRILRKIPPNVYITIEAHKRSKENLNDFENDVKYLRGEKIYA